MPEGACRRLKRRNSEQCETPPEEGAATVCDALIDRSPQEERPDRLTEHPQDAPCDAECEGARLPTGLPEQKPAHRGNRNVGWDAG